MQHLVLSIINVLALVVAVAIMWQFKVGPFAMTALSTAIANIYEPAIWSKYFIEMTTAKSVLVQSGIAAADPEVVDAANQGGRTVNMPFWQDLAHDTSATTRSKVATDTDDEISPAGLTTKDDIAVKHFRTMSWAVSPIVKYVAGSDPAKVVIAKTTSWWNKEEQRILLKTLTGIFSDATVAAALSKDLSIEALPDAYDPANLISSTAIESARALLGDAYDLFTSIVMHSVPFFRLRSLDLIEFVPVSAQNPLDTSGGKIPYYMGLRVLVDDTMTTAAGSGSPASVKYYTYLFGQGAIARVDVPLETEDPQIELYRRPTQGTGAGRTEIITRRYFILHPRGIAYTGSLSGVVSPSDSDISSDNWTQVYQTKNIRIARLITNG